MREPQEIEEREHEIAVARVAAVDVAKASGVVCTRVPRDGGRGFVTKVWPVDATTNAILELADHLAGLQVEKVVLESTSDYWRPFFYLLEAAGLAVDLVNARDVKNAPGRPKTDKLDAVWLAKLAGWGMLRPSFVPPPEIRQLRDYTRLRTDLTRERARHWQRLEKLLEDALIKVTTVASRIDTMSVRDMIEALIAGQRDPQALADLARGRMKAKRAALVEALTGRFDDHHGELAAILLAQIDSLTGQIDQLTARIGDLVAAIPAAQGVNTDGSTGPGAGQDTAPVPPAIARLEEIPGISRHAAQVIIAEVGPGHEPLPHPGAPGVLGETVPADPAVRGPHPPGADRQGQPIPQRRPGRCGRCGRQDRHVPGRAVPAAGQAPRQAQGPGRHRPHPAGHHLAPARRPHRPLPRPRHGLLHQPPRHRPQSPQPRPPARSPRLHRHPHPSRLAT